MHHFRNQRTLIRFIAAAFFEWAKWGLGGVAIFQLLTGILLMNHAQIIEGGTVATAAMLSFVTGLVLGRRAFCPLCMTPILGMSCCRRHRRVRSLLGSVRLKVAWDALMKCRIVCPYCNECVDLTR